MPKESRVVCAANRYEDGRIVLGARHFDHLMHDVISDLRLEKNEPEQGFIDQFGNFLDRKEAYIVAQRQGQIIRDHHIKGILYSEHLY